MYNDSLSRPWRFVAQVQSCLGLGLLQWRRAIVVVVVVVAIVACV
jgi:hypothetical protein